MSDPSSPAREGQNRTWLTLWVSIFLYLNSLLRGDLHIDCLFESPVDKYFPSEIQGTGLFPSARPVCTHCTPCWLPILCGHGPAAPSQRATSWTCTSHSPDVGWRCPLGCVDQWWERWHEVLLVSSAVAAGREEEEEWEHSQLVPPPTPQGIPKTPQVLGTVSEHLSTLL